MSLWELLGRSGELLGSSLRALRASLGALLPLFLSSRCRDTPWEPLFSGFDGFTYTKPSILKPVLSWNGKRGKQGEQEELQAVQEQEEQEEQPEQDEQDQNEQQNKRSKSGQSNDNCNRGVSLGASLARFARELSETLLEERCACVPNVWPSSF